MSVFSAPGCHRARFEGSELYRRDGAFVQTNQHRIRRKDGVVFWARYGGEYAALVWDLL